MTKFAVRKILLLGNVVFNKVFYSIYLFIYLFVSLSTRTVAAERRRFNVLVNDVNDLILSNFLILTSCLKMS